MLKNRMEAAVEAILFASGEPVQIKRLEQVLSIGKLEVILVIDNLMKKLEKRNSGICIVKLGDSVQLCTRPEFAEDIRIALDLKRHVPISSAAMEVLAIIAYNQPVTKNFINEIRGVDCSGIISGLLEKNLIEERGRLNLPGKPLLYGTTSIFLRCFGISSLDELPPVLNEKVLDSENEKVKKEEDEKMVTEC